MGRTILAEDFLQEYIGRVCVAHPWTIGLIVGHSTNQKDYAVCLVPSPQEDIENENHDKQSTLEGVSEHWIAEHARQVTRMLPGGLSVMGVFAAAPPTVMRDCQAKLRQIVFAVHKLMRKRLVAATAEAETQLDWTLLQICPTTKKLTCQTFNVLDPRCTAKPGDWKFQSFLFRWPYLHCRLHVNVTVPLEHQATDCGQYSKQISSGLVPFVETIRSSLALVNGQLRDPQSSLESIQTKRRTTKKAAVSGSGSGGTRFNVELLDQNRAMCNDKVDQKLCGACIEMHGTMECRSYVHNKANVADAVQAVKEDVIRSLQARLELLSDELRQSSTEEEVKEVQTEPPSIISTPKRVFTQLTGTHLSVCDYAFHDETPQDSVDRFKELLNLQVTEDELELDAEKIQDVIDLEISERSSSHSGEDIDERPELTKRRPRRYLGAVAGVAGALLAAGLSYLALNQD